MIVQRLTSVCAVGTRPKTLILVKEIYTKIVAAGVFKTMPRIYTTRLASETVIVDIEFDSFQDMDERWLRGVSLPEVAAPFAAFQELSVGPIRADFLETDTKFEH